jgi:hypothetical protein
MNRLRRTDDVVGRGPRRPERYDLWTAFGEVPECARELAAGLDPGVSSAFVVEKAMELVFPDRVDDPMFVDALSRSGYDNVEAMWRIIAGKSPMGVATPLGAYAFAETAADAGVPVSQFERTYRIGVALVWTCWWREARACAERTGASYAELVETPTMIIHAYLDALLSPTLARYDITRADTRRSLDQLQRNILRQALEGGAALDEREVAHALRVRSGGEYLAFVTRGERLDYTRVVEPAKRATDGGAVITHQHGPDHWIVWIWREAPFVQGHVERLRRVLSNVGVTAALGDAAPGAEGLGSTGREALEASRLQELLGDGESLLAYDDVRLEAFLLRDPAEARRFVRTELRALDDDGVRAARLRETATLWLANGSHVSTAAALAVHEHTVRNRVAQAEELLGRGLTARRTELLVALRLRRILGSRS